MKLRDGANRIVVRISLLTRHSEKLTTNVFDAAYYLAVELRSRARRREIYRDRLYVNAITNPQVPSAAKDG